MSDIYVVSKTDVLQVDIHMKNGYISGIIIDTKIDETSDSDDWRMKHYPPRHEMVEDTVITVKYNAKNETELKYQMLPTKIGLLGKEEGFDIEIQEGVQHEYEYHLLQVKFPKEALRCHVNCLHCKNQDKRDISPTHYDRDYESDEYGYSDDSDDSYCFVFLQTRMRSYPVGPDLRPFV